MTAKGSRERWRQKPKGHPTIYSFFFQLPFPAAWGSVSMTRLLRSGGYTFQSQGDETQGAEVTGFGCWFWCWWCWYQNQTLHVLQTQFYFTHISSFDTRTIQIVPVSIGFTECNSLTNFSQFRQNIQIEALNAQQTVWIQIAASGKSRAKAW